MVNFTDFLVEMRATITNLRVSYKELPLVSGGGHLFLIVDFGVIVCCMNRVDYTQLLSFMNEKYKGWRPIFLTVDDRLEECKNRILWGLMKSGYIRYIRTKYPSQFKNLLMFNNLGRKIIEKRLSIWGKNPQYKFFVEENKMALNEPISFVSAQDPSFFDYMPEEE